MNNYTYSRSYSSKGYKNPTDDWLHTLLFYVLPFLVINGLIFFFVTTTPKCTLTVGENHNYVSAEIEITLKSVLPTKNLTVTLDSEPVELTAKGKKTYTATLEKNGLLEISVGSINGMSTTRYEQISVLDDIPPSCEEYSIEEGILSFKLVDTQSGIDYNSIYATDHQGLTVLPLSTDRQKGTITFAMDPMGLTVHSKDLTGNEGQTVFNLNNEDNALDNNEATAGTELQESSQETESSSTTQ